MDIEQRLRDSLAAPEPAADLEVAVMSRLREQQRQAAPKRRAVAWRIPAAFAAAVFSAAVGLHWYGTQQQAARDREQLLLALAITSHQLNQVQQKLVRTDASNPPENGT